MNLVATRKEVSTLVFLQRTNQSGTDKTEGAKRNSRDGLRTKTPLRHRSAGIVRKAGKYYERVVAAAAATFFAALAAFAAVDALRRRLVFGGVAGASPISSALIMLVTNSFGP
jgi:hypothetical protein